MPIGAWLAFGTGQGVRGMWVGLIAGLTAAAVLLMARWTVQTRGERWRRFSLTRSATLDATASSVRVPPS
jgi:MATE family multidrug resistance protein